jgi:hypothetical protein
MVWPRSLVCLHKLHFVTFLARGILWLHFAYRSFTISDIEDISGFNNSFLPFFRIAELLIEPLISAGRQFESRRNFSSQVAELFEERLEAHGGPGGVTASFII